MESIEINRALLEKIQDRSFKKALFGFWVIISFSAVLFNITAIMPLFWADAIGAIVVLPLIFVADKFKYRSLSRLSFVFFLNFYFYIYSVTFGHQISAEYFYLGLLAIPFLFFSIQQKKYIGLSLCISLFFGTLCSLQELTSASKFLISAHLPLPYMQHLHFFTSFFVLVSLLLIFFNEFLREHGQLTTNLSREILKHKTISESMSEGLVVQDSKGKILSFNSAAQEILGLKVNEAGDNASINPQWHSTHSDGSKLPPEEYPAMAALKTNMPVMGKVMGLSLPSGEQKWIKINAMPFSFKKENQVVSTFSDITDEVRTSDDIQHIFNHSMDLLCIVGTDGRFKRVSPSFTKLLGFDEETFLTQPFLNFVHPDDLVTTYQVQEELSKGAPVINFQNRYKSKSGSYKLINWTFEPDLNTKHIYASGRDVTEMRSVEIRNHQIFTALKKSAIIAFADEDGKIIEANDKLCEISGYTSEELAAISSPLISTKTHSSEIVKILWDTIRDGKTWSGDLTNMAKDKTLFHLRGVVAPIHGLNGNIEQYMAILFNVTKQKEVEAQLVEAQKIAKIGSWRFNLRTGEQSWSAEHYRIFEIPENQSPDTLFQMYKDRIHPDDQAGLDLVMQRALNQGEDFVYNHRVTLDGGTKIKHVQGIGKVTKDSSGKPLFISGTCQDLTDQISLQNQSKFVLEEMGIGLWKFNPITQALFWDESMYALYEMNQGDSVGQYEGWVSSLTPESKEQAIDDLNQALLGNKEFNTTFEIITKNGIKKQIGGRGRVIRNEKNEPIMMLGLNWDRTKDVTLEKALHQERAKALLNSKLASLGEMSAGVAHEINNPLAIVMGNISILKKFKDDPEKFEEKIATTLKACNRISKIVTGLRKFSRSTEETHRVVNNMKQIINESFIMIEAKAKRHEVNIELDLQNKEMIVCDEIEIEQVIVNLMNNGIDAIKNLENKWIKVNSFDRDDYVVVQVIDSGGGIPVEIEAKLFQPFFTTKAVGEGTGLGLSIAKGILDQHKAVLQLNREFGNTCFEILFPIYKEV